MSKYFEHLILYHEMFEKFYKKVLAYHGTTKLKKEKKSEYYNIATEIIDNILSNQNEKEIDLIILSDEMKSSMKIYIESEIEISDDILPSEFEVRFNDYEIYKTNDLSIKINGIIDRVDFKKCDNGVITSARIVDYKPSAYKDQLKKIIEDIKKESNIDNILRLKKELLIEYLQPILYLDFIVNKYSYLDDIEYLSVAFSAYNRKDLLNREYFRDIDMSFIIKELLSSSDDKITEDNRYSSLKNYIGYVFNNMHLGLLDHFPEEKLCLGCPKYSMCSYSFKA